MRIRSATADASAADVPMTPMIDCVFLLLIFFLVTASLKKPHKELPIELQPADAAKVTKAQHEVVLTLDAKGKLFYDGDPDVGKEQLFIRLERLQRESPETRVRIDLDRQVPGYHLIELLNTLKKYRFTQVGFRSRD